MVVISKIFSKPFTGGTANEKGITGKQGCQGRPKNFLADGYLEKVNLRVTYEKERYYRGCSVKSTNSLLKKYLLLSLRGVRGGGLAMTYIRVFQLLKSF